MFFVPWKMWEEKIRRWKFLCCNRRKNDEKIQEEIKNILKFTLNFSWRALTIFQLRTDNLTALNETEQFSAQIFENPQV